MTLLYEAARNPTVNLAILGIYINETKRENCNIGANTKFHRKCSKGVLVGIDMKERNAEE